MIIKLALVALGGLLFLQADAATEKIYGPFPASFQRAIDGDTYDLRIYIAADYPKQIVFLIDERTRLLGWDTPEPNAKLLCERKLAEKAKAIAGKWLQDHDAGLMVLATGYDNFGRLLITPFDGAALLHEHLLAEGVARPWGAKGAGWCMDL